MVKIIQSVIAIAMSYFLIFGISNVLKFETWWLSLLICFGCGYLVLYMGRPYHLEEQKIKQEYVINLHNNKTGELFTLSKYPNYKIQHSGTDGNDYISDSGVIICTKYVEKTENVKVKEGGISIHLFCILICCFSFFLWMSNIHIGYIEDRIESYWQVIISNIYNLKDDDMERMLPVEQGSLLVKGGKEIIARFGKNVVHILNGIKNKL